MNENLQLAVTDLINTALSSAKTAAEFITAEMPDVVQQLLLWHGVRSFILFLMGVAAAVALVLHWRWTIRTFPRNKDNRVDILDDAGFFKMIGLFLTTVGCAVFSCVMLNMTWLQILIAPKVWLIEYAAWLVK